MRTLDFDMSRCRPNRPDDTCRKCLRWADLPGQTWGGLTPVAFGWDDSTGEHCSHIPVEESDQ